MFHLKQLLIPIITTLFAVMGGAAFAEDDVGSSAIPLYAAPTHVIGFTDNFEGIKNRAVGPPYGAKVAPGGTNSVGFDINLNLAAHGRNNAFIRTTSGWASLSRPIWVRGGASYEVHATVRSGGPVQSVHMGLSSKGTTFPDYKFIPTPAYKDYATRVTVPAGLDHLIFFIGFNSVGKDAWIQIDDVWVK